MSEAIQLDDYIDDTHAGSYQPRAAGRRSTEGGGDMDDVLKRLGAVESSVSELRVQVSGIASTMATKDDLNAIQVQVSGIAATLPYLATKDDLKEVRGEVAAIAASIPHMATNDGLTEVRAIIPHLATNAALNNLKATLHETETRIIKWIIASVLTTSGLAFSIARFVH
jgi:DNA-binding FrmR family transcriptional regulator